MLKSATKAGTYPISSLCRKRNHMVLYCHLYLDIVKLCFAYRSVITLKYKSHHISVAFVGVKPKVDKSVEF